MFSVLRAARRWHVLSGERPTALAIQLFWERSAAGGLFLAVVRWHWKQIIVNSSHLEIGKCGHIEVDYLGHLEIRNLGHLLDLFLMLVILNFEFWSSGSGEL